LEYNKFSNSIKARMTDITTTRGHIYKSCNWDCIICFLHIDLKVSLERCIQFLFTMFVIERSLLTMLFNPARDWLKKRRKVYPVLLFSFKSPLSFDDSFPQSHCYCYFIIDTWHIIYSQRFLPHQNISKMLCYHLKIAKMKSFLSLEIVGIVYI